MVSATIALVEGPVLSFRSREGQAVELAVGLAEQLLAVSGYHAKTLCLFHRERNVARQRNL